ncbi:MAG TPA: hypothetical protein VN222_17885, partial [Novosphingobium sp.]|nr:hypothetical protein [Novosphingobium sp.]
KGAPRPPSFAPATGSVMRIGSAAYNLGLSRGYSGFTQNPASYVLPSDKNRLDMPDLSAFASSTDGGAGGDNARLAPHIQLNERERAGRSPRTLESTGEQSVDVGGSYRVTRNLDVTAGVRYSRDSDRLKPVPDGKSDSQSVFVGTQFRF